MRIKQICKNCGKIYSEIDVDGGNQRMREQYLRDLSRNRTMCLDCGGDVIYVEDGKEKSRWKFWK